MDLDGAGEANGMGQDVIQANKVKILGLEKGQSGRQVPLLYRRNTNPSIPTISEKPIKSLGKFFDSSLRDAASIKNTCEELEGWLKDVDKMGLENSRRGFTSTGFCQGYCGHCSSMSS